MISNFNPNNKGCFKYYWDHMLSQNMSKAKTNYIKKKKLKQKVPYTKIEVVVILMYRI